MIINVTNAVINLLQLYRYLIVMKNRNVPSVKATTLIVSLVCPQVSASTVIAVVRRAEEAEVLLEDDKPTRCVDYRSQLKLGSFF